MVEAKERGGDALLADLERARSRLRDAEDAVEEIGEDDLRRVEDALDRATGLLDRYEGSATGTGDFQAYVEFQGSFEEHVEGLPADLPSREAFERANDVVDQRRLSETDFARAREALEPARDLVARLEARADAEAEVADAERAVGNRIEALDERIAELERLTRLGEADLDAPTGELREPIEAYDEAVREAFASFRREASARAVLGFVADAGAYPLVDFDQPPAELREYVESHEIGAEPTPTLLEYADYSPSKLDHYVDDPATFRTRVPVHRTYLDRLSADPLVVGWPPPEAGELRARAGELVSVLAKFADEDVVARARRLQRLALRADYERLRDAARAEAELTDAERERLAAGEVEAELEEARNERQRLRGALAEG